MTCACDIRVRGVVQGVGFRPFVYRLARAKTLTGWVRNDEDGVAIHLEGGEPGFSTFLEQLQSSKPPGAVISQIEMNPAEPAGFTQFTIRESQLRGQPKTRISPDLPVCGACLEELFDPADLRFGYPYINCTNCGPRYSVIQGLPYDRVNTTMRTWTLDDACGRQYDDPADRRFHAQPVACPACGPHFKFCFSGETLLGDQAVVARAALELRGGHILAIKGLGGYHLACDALNKRAVMALRERKFRKERPFAVMVRDLVSARKIAHLSTEAADLLLSPARPIVLARATQDLSGVAPDTSELGIMLAYTPLHHLLFAAGAPDVLVMTSANRSSEPIAYRDDEVVTRLTGIADAFLIGERPIARRIDDSVVRAGAFGPSILRRARGYAPGAVATLPFASSPILAVGADLKNSITLVAQGQAFVSQHIGDLDHYQCRQAFCETINDLTSMYEIDRSQLIVAHDLHPQYASTVEALELECSAHYGVQHHRAHIASVLAERAAWDEHVIGVSFDGTGYGDDGSIWGGEFFAGSIAAGFERVLHLRPATLPGGDAAARFPVQAAAGYLAQVDPLPNLTEAPFLFPRQYLHAKDLLNSNIRSFTTTSAGRLFDTAAALLGFTRAVTYEGQAAIWLEQLARQSPPSVDYPFPIDRAELDFRPLLDAVVSDRMCGRPVADIARAFQLSVAAGIASVIRLLCEAHATHTAVLSGGVFQNELLLEDLKEMFVGSGIRLWRNSLVPPNDGGVSLGQAAIAAFQHGAKHYA